MIQRILRRIALVEKVLACTMIVALLGAVPIQVVSRYVFESPLAWTEEVARFLLVWMTFIAAGYVMAERLHVSVDIAVAKLGTRAVAAVDTVATLVVIIASAVLAVAGVGLARGTVGVSAPATSLPMSVVYAAGVVGFALIALHGVGNVIQNLVDPKSVPGGMENLEKEGL